MKAKQNSHTTVSTPFNEIKPSEINSIRKRYQMITKSPSEIQFMIQEKLSLNS